MADLLYFLENYWPLLAILFFLLGTAGDIVITAANVAPQANAQIISGTVGAGVTVAAGKLLYYDTVTGTYFLAVASTTQAQSVVAGMAVCSAGPGQPVFIQIAGDVAIGAVIVTGQPYTLSITTDTLTTGGVLSNVLPGSGKYPATIGMGVSTSILRIAIANNNNVAQA